MNFFIACGMPRTSSRTSTVYTPCDKVELIRGGHAYFSKLKELIQQARYAIHLQVYIFEADVTGHEIADALMQAAQRGIQVYLIPDGYASSGLPGKFIKELQAAGIQFRYFEPLLRSSHFYFGRRLHHKVVVVDAKYCLVGGINISNRYNDTREGPAWLDWAVFIEGPIAAGLEKICMELWSRSMNRFRRPARHEKKAAVPMQQCSARIRRNDWVQHRNQISRSYLEMFRKAESHIMIMSSYFLPGRLFRKSLSQAAKRGVKITLILAGTSDVAVSKMAERYIYRWAFRKGMNIYEYRKTVLHGKMATYDGKWVTVGSYNVNNISAYASIELNMDVQNDHFARNVEEKFAAIIQNDCEQITEEMYRTHYGLFSRCLQQGAYLLIRVIFFLFTFYFKQESIVATDTPE